ncbi:hypothetical protein Dsin_004401 [Dipteronia sinensis]|uniref:P-type ATPase A domain-containing protein n=1 Tax=Dipteronia sinensis TaxID=43782 RepID=A0AAE0BAY5_9ROSI|nr:hypothetical protein Dsin_004401 [Dipteronia sinensis]
MPETSDLYLRINLDYSFRVLCDIRWSEEDAAELVPGDILSIKLRDIVLADAAMQSALTRESLPVTKNPGDGVYSCSMCKQGEIKAVVIATGVHTFFRKAAHLVENTAHVGHFQKVLTAIGNFCICSIAHGMVIEISSSRVLSDLKSTEDKSINLVAQIEKSQRRATYLEKGQASLEGQLAVVTVVLVVTEKEAASKDQIIYELKEELEGKDNALACAVTELELRSMDKFKRSPTYNAAMYCEHEKGKCGISVRVEAALPSHTEDQEIVQEDQCGLEAVLNIRRIYRLEKCGL